MHLLPQYQNKTNVSSDFRYSCHVLKTPIILHQSICISTRAFNATYISCPNNGSSSSMTKCLNRVPRFNIATRAIVRRELALPLCRRSRAVIASINEDYKVRLAISYHSNSQFKRTPASICDPLDVHEISWQVKAFSVWEGVCVPADSKSTTDVVREGFDCDGVRFCSLGRGGWQWVRHKAKKCEIELHLEG
jgi:hypothetical protein